MKKEKLLNIFDIVSFVFLIASATLSSIFNYSRKEVYFEICVVMFALSLVFMIAFFVVDNFLKDENPVEKTKAKKVFFIVKICLILMALTWILYIFTKI